MATYHGLVSGLIKGSSTGGEFAVLTGVSTTNTVSSFPSKGLNGALYALHVTGISGTMGAYVVGAVGGATFVIVGKTAISANGTALLGSTATAGPTMWPKYVTWESAEDGSGFDGKVFVSGEY